MLNNRALYLFCTDCQRIILGREELEFVPPEVGCDDSIRESDRLNGDLEDRAASRGWKILAGRWYCALCCARMARELEEECEKQWWERLIRRSVR